MIDKKLIADTVAGAIEGTGMFVVDITVSPSDDIVVELDSPGDLDVDTCARVNRALADALEAVDPEADFSIEVGSAGITSPLKVRGQYLKNIGREVEVLTRDGRKLRGTLTAVSGEDEPLSFTLTSSVKVKEPGQKRPLIKEQTETFNVADSVKSVVPTIDFK